MQFQGKRAEDTRPSMHLSKLRRKQSKVAYFTNCARHGRGKLLTSLTLLGT